MFARPSSSAYVCLRCHLRLTRQKPHPLYTAVLQCSPFSVFRPHSDLDNSQSRWSDDTYQRSDHDGRPRRPRHKFKHFHPLGKLRGKKGGQVREATEALAIDRLGEPADVIVLRDDPNQDPEEAKEHENAGDTQQSSSREAILDAITNGDTVMDQESVNQQIDALRPRQADPNSGRSIITLAEYTKLCRVLTSSYNKLQLGAYIARARVSNRLPWNRKEKQEEKGEYKNITLKFQPWRPKRYTTGSPKQKNTRTRLADNVLQLCWNVEIAEEVERIGELRCTLPKDGILLFTAGKTSYLDEIAENRRVKIEVDQQALQFRIFADKDSAIYALEDVNRLWSQRHSERFRLNTLCSSSASPSEGSKRTLVALRQEDIAMASTLTRTVIRYIEEQREKRTVLVIDGVGKEQVWDAKRALLALVDIPTKQSSRAYLEYIGDASRLVLQEVSSLNGIPHRYCRTAFGRAQVPVTRALRRDIRQSDQYSLGENAYPHVSIIDEEVSNFEVNTETKSTRSSSNYGDDISLGRITSFLNDFLIPADPGHPTKTEPKQSLEVESQLWDQDIELSVSVSLGQIIHPKSSELNSSINPVLSTDSCDAIFLPQVPKFSEVLPYLTWDRKAVPDILSFRLLHNPWKQSGPTLPEIRLDFEINSLKEVERVANFKGLYTLTHDQSGMVMLPSRAVDICFKRQKLIKVSPDGLQRQQNVKEFIEQTKANILAGSGRLRAPGSLLIHIPYAIAGIASQAHKSRKQKKPGDTSNNSKATQAKVLRHITYAPPENADATGVLAQYYFVGVEHRQPAGYEFEGYPVRYTSVEAGKLGGRYGDLEIIMPELTRQTAKDAPEQRKGLAQVALKMVDLVHRATHGTLQRPIKISPMRKGLMESSSPGQLVAWDIQGIRTGKEVTRAEEIRFNGVLERAAAHGEAVITGAAKGILDHFDPAPREDAGTELEARSSNIPANQEEIFRRPIEIASDQCQSTTPDKDPEPSGVEIESEPQALAAASG